MNLYHKRIYGAEREIMLHLADTDILPLFYIEYHGVCKITGEPTYYSHMEMYSGTLEMYFDNGGLITPHIIAELTRLATKMHDCGVIHGDLQLKNIVYNPQTADLKIIDFGESGYTTQFLSGDETLEEAHISLQEEKLHDNFLILKLEAALACGDLTVKDRYWE